MRRMGLGLSVFFLVSGAVVLAQQPPTPPVKPNFAGTWVQQLPAQGAGSEQVIKQTDKTLTISHASEGDGHQMVYNLDGTEAQSTMQSHGMAIVTVSKVTWNGNRMTITSTSTYEPGRVLDQTMVWSIDDKGQLVIDHTAAMTGLPVETTQIVYRKK